MAALAAAGAGTPSSARKEKEPPARGTKPAGIVKVTRGVRLGPPPGAPSDRVWHYLINYPFQDKGTRETLALWPLNEARNGLKPPLLIRDGLVELGPPPNGTWWGIDHPSAMTVHLGDGQWHNVIGFRLYEKAEMTDFVAPTAHTGAYLEEVISAGSPIPVWNF